jgi:hypothetical protein
MKNNFKPGDTITWKIKKKKNYKLILFLALFCLCFYWIRIGFKPKNYPILPTQTTVFEIQEPIPYVKKIYDERGLPIRKEWLTNNEWKGRHLKDSSRTMRKEFKIWKKDHIQNFVSWIRDAAQEEQRVSGIPYELVVVQAVLESQHGTSKLSVLGNNLFGIKHRGKGEDYIIISDDSPTDRFRTYPKGKWWSLRHHSKVLNRKYRSRIKGKPSLDKWIDCLCGGRSIEQSKRFVDNGGQVYATSCFNGKISYSQKLSQLINKL